MALPAKKFEEQESEDIAPDQKEKIRQEWRARLEPAIKALNPKDLKPRASLKSKKNLPKAVDGARSGNKSSPLPNTPPPQQAGEEREQGEEPGPGNEAELPGAGEPGAGGGEPGAEKSEVNENVEPRNEGRIARRLRQRVEAKREARSQAYKRAGLEAGGSGMFTRYRQVKKILRWVRGISLAGTALGDLIFSFSALFWSLVLEWGFCKLKGWPMFKEPYQELDEAAGEMVEKWRDAPGAFLDKSIWYTGWIVVIVAVILVITLLVIINYVRENPVEALKYFPALKNLGL